MQCKCKRSSKWDPEKCHDVCQGKKRLSSQSSEVTLVNTMEDVGKFNTVSAKPSTCDDQCPSIYLFNYLRGGSYDKD